MAFRVVARDIVVGLLQIAHVGVKTLTQRRGFGAGLGLEEIWLTFGTTT